MSENLPDFDLWDEAIQSKFEPQSLASPVSLDCRTFDNLLGHWGACTDQPAVLFSEELINAYPEARVVLVERDVNRWYESYTKTVINGVVNPFVPLASLIDPGFLGRMARQSDLVCKHYFHIPYPRERWLMVQKPFVDLYRANAKSVYLQHNELVRRVTPSERLLVFKLEDGWGPLCEFLGKPVPEVPFPQVNETAALQEKINLYIAESYRRSLVRFIKAAVPVMVVAAGVAAWWTWFR